MEPQLSPQEQKFCEEYVANGGNGTKAAQAAGYAEAGSRVTAHRILKRERIIREIERLRRAGNAAVLNGELIRVEAEPLDGDVMPPATDEDKALAAELNRTWTIARMMRIAQSCMGEIEQTQLKIITRREGDGSTKVSAIQVRGRTFDAAGANAALALLSKELDRQEGLPDKPNGQDPAQLPNRQSFEAAMAKYAEAARGKAPASNGNGHAKPNGHGRPQ